MESDMMFAEPALYQKEIQQVVNWSEVDVNIDILAGRLKLLSSKRNCRVGAKYRLHHLNVGYMRQYVPVPDAYGIHPGGLRYHWQDTPNGPEVRDCKEGEVCDNKGGFLGIQNCNNCDRTIY